MKSNQTGVYAILNNVSGKVYVGSGSGIRGMHKRRLDHWESLYAGLHYNPHLQKAWNKYGASAFEFLVLEECGPQDCVKCEQWWIGCLKSSNRECWYNLSPTAGSPLGVKHSVETRRKMSLSKIGTTDIFIRMKLRRKCR